MKIRKEEGITILVAEEATLEQFMGALKVELKSVKKENLVLNLLPIASLTATDLTGLQEYSDAHRAGTKSFVVVTDKVTYDDLPEELIVVPTVREAKDIIELDEIERDLGL